MNAPTISDFTGKAALITGAGSGIGLATAQLLLSRGATIGVADMSMERLQEAFPEDSVLKLSTDVFRVCRTSWQA